MVELMVMKLLSPPAMNGGFNITFHSNNVVHSLPFAFFAYDQSSFGPENWKNEKVEQSSTDRSVFRHQLHMYIVGAFSTIRVLQTNNGS